MKRKLSIIIPVYNGEHFIEKLLKCLKKSIMDDDTEIIVVDDGSEDSTFSILKNYESKLFRIFYKENGGVSSARNFGIQKAQGEYITFLDSDDLISDNYIEEVYDLLKSDSDMVCFDIDLLYPQKCIEHSLKLKTEKIIVNKEEVFEHIINGKYIKKFSNSPCNKIYKKSILDENSIYFKEDKTIGEDLLFNLEYYLNIREISCTEKNLYKYVIRTNSIMNTYTNTLVDELFKYTDILYDISKKYKIPIEKYKIKMFYIFRLYPIIIGETKAPTKKEGLDNIKRYLNHPEMKVRIPFSDVIKMNYIQFISYMVFTFHLSIIVFNFFWLKNKLSH